MTPTLMGSVLGVISPAGLGHLGPALVTGLPHDRPDLGIGSEALEALRVPVEDHPDAVVLVGVAEDERALRPVLASLLGALRREDVGEAVEVLDLRGCQEHVSSSLIRRRCSAPMVRGLSGPAIPGAWGKCPMRRERDPARTPTASRRPGCARRSSCRRARCG